MIEESIYIQVENEDIWNKTKEIFVKNKKKIIAIATVLGGSVVTLIIGKRMFKENKILKAENIKIIDENKILKAENIKLIDENINLKKTIGRLASEGTRNRSSNAARELNKLKKTA